MSGRLIYRCFACDKQASVARYRERCDECQAIDRPILPPPKAGELRLARLARQAVRRAEHARQRAERRAKERAAPLAEATRTLAARYGVEVVQRALYATDGSLDLQAERINREHYQLMCDLAGVRRIA